MKPSEGANVIYSKPSMADSLQWQGEQGCTVNFKFIFCVKLDNVTDSKFKPSGYNI